MTDPDPATAASRSIDADRPHTTHRPMRIAFVTETYPPEINGVALTVARMVEGLHARHHDLQLIRPRQDERDRARPVPRFDEVLVRGRPIPMYAHLRMGLPAQATLMRLWSTVRPDVVHIATEGPLGWSALRAATRLGLPVTSDFRTNFHAYSGHYGIGWLRAPIMAYLRRFHNAAQATMVPTEPLRSELTAAGFRHVTVVSRGVDTTRFDPSRRDVALRANWGVADDTVVVAYVGRLAREKNLGTLVDAFDAVERMAPPGRRARLLLVGEGPEEDALRRRRPDALFAGRRTGGDLARHYASADLFVFPSRTETFGNVTLEAMASGLPVVAFDHAAAAQLIVDGRDGVLVPFGDTARFVDAAGALAFDRQRRERFGAAARQRATQQGWDAITTRFEATLARVVADPPTSDALQAAAC